MLGNARDGHPHAVWAHANGCDFQPVCRLASQPAPRFFVLAQKDEEEGMIVVQRVVKAGDPK
jgi:hypothetical protein